MGPKTVVEMPEVRLAVPQDGRPLGTRVLEALVEVSQFAVRRLASARGFSVASWPAAALGRLRGTGRGVSSTQMLGEIEKAHPIQLESPFEGSDLVSGAVWIASELLGIRHDTSVAKLRWDRGALDLPMHVHDHSDRFIIVQEGRGYFHVTDESFDDFTGTRVRSIPARERDVFLFRRGVVHTFSTDAEPMTLLSCQLPFIPFDHPDQYRLPKHRWIAGENPDQYPVAVACDAAWTVLATQTLPISALDTGICGS